MNSQTTDRLKERAWPVLLRLIIIAVAMLVTTLISTVKANAQIVVANPLEWAVLVEGNELIDGQIKNETEGMTRTAVLQSTIAAEFSGIKSWEKKYNAYLKSADGFASSIKAATYLYNDGVRLFINLSDIRKAIAANPQGLAATLSMNNLYIETATELVSVYSALKEAVATGGDGNMLTGAERSETLWMIEDRLKAFNHKLSLLSLSLRYYTLSDVWYNATEGIIDRDYGEIARHAQDRWKRASRTY